MQAPNLLNLRELGGLPLRTGGTTRMQSLLRADSLDRLTQEGMRTLVGYGLRTIIDLRWPEEISSGEYNHLLTGQSVDRIHISLLKSSESEWRSQKIIPYSKDQLNCIALARTGPQIFQVLRAIAQAPSGVVLFHCHSGKDRTGLVSTLLLALAGVELPAIERDYTMSEDQLRDGYLADRSDLSPEEIEERLSCPPQQVINTLSYLEQEHQGIVGYLESIGLTHNDIQSLKHRLIPSGVIS